MEEIHNDEQELHQRLERLVLKFTGDFWRICVVLLKRADGVRLFAGRKRHWQ